MPKHTKFSRVNDDIHIFREEWDQVALTTYREDYYKELSTHEWHLNDGYPTNTTLGGGLHRYIMRKWYTDEVFDEFDRNGYIVEHLNNNHMDARISNLEFIKKCYNTAKGQTLDIDSKRLSHRIALNIFKDFSTGYYQITIGCNDTIVGQKPDGNEFYVNEFKLLYTCDYRIVINDAENILLLYETEGRIDLSTLHASEKKVIPAPDIQLSEEEKQSTVIVRDGVPYLIIGNGKTQIDSVHYDEGWRPSQK